MLPTTRKKKESKTQSGVKVQYTFLPLLLKSGLFDEPDCTSLRTLILNEDSEDDDISRSRASYENTSEEDDEDDNYERASKYMRKDFSSDSLEYTSSPSYDKEQEDLQIFGYYFCEVCNIELSSLKVYTDHMSGKRHLKNIKLKDVSKAVAQTLPPSAATKGISKYPMAPPGVIRRKVRKTAEIQHIINDTVRKPCPGLNLIKEIQGLKQTIYYCKACNSTCSSSSIISHLTGFKHQLNLVKNFKPGYYECFDSERKNELQDTVLGILQAIENKEGRGRINVEVEEIEGKDVSYDVNKPSTSRDRQVESLKNSGLSFRAVYDIATIPSRSSADFYCKFCDSHMNSEDAWNAHITGKRHITNLKKLPGDRPSKTKTIPLPNVKAKLLKKLENECINEPVVGLDEIKEVQNNKESATYHCFLCASFHTSMDIIDHILSTKHRMKYLDHIQYSYDLSGFSERSSAQIIEGFCAEVEAERGRGKPSVHIDKNAIYG